MEQRTITLNGLSCTRVETRAYELIAPVSAVSLRQLILETLNSLPRNVQQAIMIKKRSPCLNGQVFEISLPFGHGDDTDLIWKRLEEILKTVEEDICACLRLNEISSMIEKGDQDGCNDSA